MAGKGNNPNQGDKGNRDFSRMNEEKKSDISRKGNQNAPTDDRTFSPDKVQSSEAGRMSGDKPHNSGKRSEI